MTKLLEQAFLEAAKLPAAEQDVLAARLLAELAGDDDFDRAISNSGDKLANWRLRPSLSIVPVRLKSLTRSDYEVAHNSSVSRTFIGIA